MGGPPGGPGGFADFQKSHKYAFQLARLAGNIERLRDEGKAALAPSQAKAVLAILQPLRARESLDETAAREALKKLQHVLTDEQRAAINSMPPPEHQFRQGGPPPGPPRSGPPPGPNPRAMKGFNPLKQPPGPGGPPPGGAPPPPPPPP